MHSLLPFIISGVTTGAVYGLAGSGLVITYRTSGVFNFAHGAIAAAAAYFFYWLTVDLHVGWEIAFVLAVGVLGTVLGLLLEIVGRYMARRLPAIQIVATIGMILIIQALATLQYGPDPIQLDQYLPDGGHIFRLAGVNVEWGQLTVTCVAVAVTAALYVFFRTARLGLMMRAVVDDGDLVGLHGTSPVRVRRVAWIIGSTLASASGVFLAPFVGLESISLTYLVVAAIGAASIGGFSSIPLTYAGGLVIGVVAAVSQKYVLHVSWLSGLPLSLPFVALLIALLVLPRRKLAAATVVENSLTVRERASGRVVAVLAVVVTGLLLVIPSLVGAKLSYFMMGILLAIMLLSLGLLVRISGQVSLCHAAFAAIGAVAFSQFMSNFHLPWLLAVLLGALVVVPVAMLVALPAIRLSGLFLGLATLAFGIMVERMIYPLSFAFGNTGAGRLMPRPGWAKSDSDFYYLLVTFLVVVAGITYLIDRGRLGRMLRGLAQSPRAMQTMGLTVSGTKVLVFCISGFFAGLSGILYGSTVSYASYADSNYTSFHSLVLLAILVVAPFGTPWFAVFAIPVAVLPGYIGGPDVSSWLNLAFGVAAVALAFQRGAPPLPRWLAALLRGRPRAAAEPAVPLARPGPGAQPDPRPRLGGATLEPGLAVRDLQVRFGGLVAVDGVSLDAPIGRVTGLIGPNGAGKTTTFNACSGLLRPTAGQISLWGSDVTGLSAQARGRMGLGRTFQVTELCESLTVRENVQMGREAGLAGWSPVSQLGITFTRAERREMAAAATEAISLCGIERIAGAPAGSLSTGERRLVEVARALAGGFDMLLLDEPSAGLDRAETERLREVLAAVVNERRCAILLVEHDMGFVMRLCDYIYVLDFGKPLFEGPPDAVATSPDVQLAYLGSTAAAPIEMSEAGK